jgi:hypothetical protein
LEDATICKCRFCRPGASTTTCADHTRDDERSYSLDRSQQLVTGLHRAWLLICVRGVRIHRSPSWLCKRRDDPSAQIVVMQVSDGCLQVMLRSQMMHAGTHHAIPLLQSFQASSRIQETLIGDGPYCGSKAMAVPQNSRCERKMSKDSGMRLRRHFPMCVTNTSMRAAMLECKHLTVECTLAQRSLPSRQASDLHVTTARQRPSAASHRFLMIVKRLSIAPHTS